ncbi:MAG: TRAFs-binding domain-containing protein [Caulobacter sp.]|nr:TRAFs-binding domain-containing protein [Caulobacter sp.]
MAGPAPLVAIVAHARAGALDQAWRLFRAAGLESVADNAAVLSVKGRLLKDQGRLATGDERRRLYGEAAEAYGQAGAIDWATYPLINAATLSLLAGEPERSTALAGRVLARIDSGEDAEPDTPYWRTATRAEAMLLLGKTHEAWLALQAAMALAPRAWEDHASTLRQFALILEARGEDAVWLDPFRPPRSLHYSGHLSVGEDDQALKAGILEILKTEQVGFGYGALAAGADIMIAEALLEQGAELHLVLPVGRQAFRAASVEPFGGDWAARFDAILDQAETVTAVGDPQSPLDIPTLELAALSAMGRAVAQARLLASHALQLSVLDSAGDGEARGGTAWSQRHWRSSGLRDLTIDSPRAAAPPPAASLARDETRMLQAVMALGPGDHEEGHLARAWIPGLLDALTAAGIVLQAPPVWTAQCLILALADPVQAAKAARTLAALQQNGRTAIDFGVVRNQPMLMGRPLERVQRLLASVPMGAICVTADFAMALNAGPDSADWPCEPIGEMPPAELAPHDDETDPAIFGLRLG